MASDHEDSDECVAAFLRACAQMLGRIPDHSRFKEHTLPNGKKTLTWNSYVSGMIGRSAEQEYHEKFGDEPGWLASCHPHHRHLLVRLASDWELELPADMPTPVPPSLADQRNYLPPRPPWKLTKVSDRPLDLEQALTKLVKSSRLRKALKQEFGPEISARMIAMMRDGHFEGDAGEELHDYLLNSIGSESETVWSVTYSTAEEDWPIEVQAYHGIFRVWSPEFDPDLFLRLSDAKAYAYSLWEQLRG